MIKRGFTLTELVLVMILITVLSSFVTERYFDMSKKAKEHAVTEAGNALATGVRSAHSQWLWQGHNVAEAISGFNDDSGNGLESGANGWPFRTTDSDNVTECIKIWEAVMPRSGRPTISATPGAADYYVTYSFNTCRYTYQGGGSMYISYNRENGMIDVNHSYT